jgi:hypothetical protein
LVVGNWLFTKDTLSHLKDLICNTRNLVHFDCRTPGWRSVCVHHMVSGWGSTLKHLDVAAATIRASCVMDILGNCPRLEFLSLVPGLLCESAEETPGAEEDGQPEPWLDHVNHRSLTHLRLGIGDDYLFRAMRLPVLTSLKLSGRHVTCQSIGLFFEQSRALEELELDHCPGIRLDSSLSGRLPRVTSLWWHSPDDSMSLIPILRAAPGLQHLYCDSLQPVGLTEISSIAPPCLETLTIRKVVRTSPHAEILFQINDVFRHCHKLNHLVLPKMGSHNERYLLELASVCRVTVFFSDGM